MSEETSAGDNGGCGDDAGVPWDVRRNDDDVRAWHRLAHLQERTLVHVGIALAAGSLAFVGGSLDTYLPGSSAVRRLVALGLVFFLACLCAGIWGLRQHQAKSWRKVDVRLEDLRRARAQADPSTEHGPTLTDEELASLRKGMKRFGRFVVWVQYVLLAIGLALLAVAMALRLLESDPWLDWV